MSRKSRVFGHLGFAKERDGWAEYYRDTKGKDESPAFKLVYDLQRAQYFNLRALVELKRGEIDSPYSSEVEEAERLFQEARGQQAPCMYTQTLMSSANRKLLDFLLKES